MDQRGPHERLRAVSASARDSTPGRDLRIEVLGGFRLRDSGRSVQASAGAERLLAYAALRRRATRRAFVAANLWPEVPEQRGYANLRAALARLDPVSRSALAVGPSDIGLSDGVSVDLHEAHDLAARLLDPAAGEAPLGQQEIERLATDLLPGWYDEWVLHDAEEWRQMRLHALEALCGRLALARSYGFAAAAASAAIRADPLRESAHAVLVRVHLAEGNQSEALRSFHRYRLLLQSELGLAPTATLRSLVADLLIPRRRDDGYALASLGAQS